MALGGVRSPRPPGGGFDGGGESEHHECVVDLVGGGGLRPRLLPDAIYRARVEPADVRRGLRIEGTPHGHRPRPALFERCVVEERIGPGVEHLRGERRGLGEVARDDPDLPRVESGHEGFERVDVHRIVQCVGNRLLHQRMLGDLARPAEVLGAGDLVGKHRGHEILGLHALDVRRDLGAAAKARHRERDVRIPAPAHVEHGRVEQGLGEHVAHRLRREVAADLVEREAVGLAEREHDRVLGRRRLQLEVELPAEALAQGKAEGPVQAAAEARVDDELHPAALVEEALQHQCVAVRQRPERRVRRAEIVDDLRARLRPGPGARGELGGEREPRFR